MRQKLMRAIDDNCEELSNYINPFDLLAEGLLTNVEINGASKDLVQVFSQMDKETVHRQVGMDQQLSCLLSILRQQPDAAFEWFIRYLCEQGTPQLARKLWNCSDMEGTIEGLPWKKTHKTVSTQTDMGLVLPEITFPLQLGHAMHGMTETPFVLFPGATDKN